MLVKPARAQRQNFQRRLLTDVQSDKKVVVAAQQLGAAHAFEHVAAPLLDGATRVAHFRARGSRNENANDSCRLCLLLWRAHLAARHPSLTVDTRA